MVDIVIPIADTALCFPWGESSGVHTPEIAHEYVITQAMSLVARTWVTAVHDPGLSVVQYSMLEIHNIEGALIDHSMEAE